ncbi:rhomboid family intramembrane serine protease [Candidatus Micrarchaeota archaeon]|nr:rhomboid family intramembrane serine protease [Candidatus Micrarchaeota archaeon]
MIVEILVGLNVLIHILQYTIPGFTELFMFDPSRPFEIWRFFTSMFLHIGFFHLFVNMYGLFIFGKSVEKKTNLFVLFIVCGLAGNLLYLAMAQMGVIGMIPAVGASGAVYGILGAFVVLYPDAKLYMLFFPVGLSGKTAAIIYGLFEFGTMFLDDGIGHAAHLGGLIIGFLFAKFLIKKTFEYYRPYDTIYQ